MTNASVSFAPAVSAPATPTLLPTGLRDALPPEAEHQAACVADLLRGFAAEGYERVEPPLVEFEDSLLADADTSVARQTFRLMDPVSQRMMGVRPDITIQVARIATSRLAHRPRPLRLAYAGDVLRVKGNQLQPQRQFTQVGVELIGAASVAADVEVIRCALDGLSRLGVAGLTVDLTVAALVPQLFDLYGLPTAQRATVRDALDRKDGAAAAEQAGPLADLLTGLLAATGPARAALMLLTSLDLPDAVQPLRRDLTEVAEALLHQVPQVGLTVDPIEGRGFEYHTGVGFTLFARQVRGELGRGGRYQAGVDPVEASTGVTLFMDAILPAVPVPAPRQRLFLPAGTPVDVGRSARADGWVTIAGLDPKEAAETSAKRLNCQAIYRDGQIVELKERA
ncbi:ATP phosphoribosyltransferase regulatory subunit [Elstera cyanobacteriorum]|uniref:ATP phosphoribosyltransferase regulatory subunit n=1 Tax=Elstera cyanobacteriorum TaxID=2022747 RepID=A0A255XQT9_9PROT|nr:ATP phosphoribosyltransferase regulatory subunit [Elstera cyanobacteriorum]OYQ19377.1 ATP phosphoribosyltransferase regulatory subunit [Elstera cyanobacteriorum]GFZ91009.1 ATP phosphoribosyltransferase regulatory subunit [Elstera cyanobacteriorum]